MRIFCFLGIILTALFLPFWIFVCMSIIYALTWNAYELLIIGLFIDAQFGDVSRQLWYLYSISSAGILALTIYIKPHLRFYQ